MGYGLDMIGYDWMILGELLEDYTMISYGLQFSWMIDGYLGDPNFTTELSEVFFANAESLRVPIQRKLMERWK